MGLLPTREQISVMNQESLEVKNRKNQISEKVEELLLQRSQARAEKNWSEADRIRDELNEMGVTVKDTSEGQYPFATVLSCIDSRVSAELIFDQGIGDIFSIRIAGNFVNTDILGSMEFACKLAGTRLIVVLGHTSCGAVKGACDDAKLGNLTSMLAKIKPAVLN